MGGGKEMRESVRKRKVNKESEILSCPRAEVRGASVFIIIIKKNLVRV